MRRISTATAVADLFGVGKPGFRDGDKAAGIPATDLNAELFNGIQEEIMAVMELQGIVPSQADFTQLRQAIQKMIIAGQRTVIIDNAVFEASVADKEVVYWDSANNRYDEAIADGTAKQNAVGIADVTNSKVYAFGNCPIMTGLTPGRYFLSDAVAGSITAIAPASNAVQVGVARTATDLFVDVDQQGVLFASDAEAQAFANTTKAISSSTLGQAFKGSNQSLAANGYQKLPGGLIIQWGTTASIPNASTGTTNFPIAFPNAGFSVVAHVTGIGSGTATASENIATFNTTQFTIFNPTGGPNTWRWIAFGY